MTSTGENSAELPAPTEPQRKGWTALKRFFRGGPQQSVMRLNPFHLFDAKPLELVEGAEGSGEVYKLERYTHCRTQLSVDILRRCEANAAILTDIRRAQEEGIDNTGNFHWPAEEVLTHLLLTRSLAQLIGEVSNTSATLNADVAPPSPGPSTSVTVLELGAGLGLASIFGARRSHSIRSGTDKIKYIATDGNSKVVELLQRNVEGLTRQNKVEAESPSILEVSEQFGASYLDARLLRWDVPEQYEPLVGSVDYIVGADCLFFEKFHESLVALVARFFVGPQGPLQEEKDVSPSPALPSERQVDAGGGSKKLKGVVFVAPSRGGSLQRWVQRISTVIDQDPRLEGVVVEVQTEFDSELSTVVQTAERTSSDFDSDRHRPLLVVLRWKKSD